MLHFKTSVDVALNSVDYFFPITNGAFKSSPKTI